MFAESRMTPQLLAALSAACPWEEQPKDPKHPDKISFLTSPLRLVFAKLNEGKTKSNGKTSYSCGFLIPATADVATLNRIVTAVAGMKYGPHFATNPKFTYPWKRQAEFAQQLDEQGKPKFKGFNVDGFFIGAESMFKIPIHGTVPNTLLSTEKGGGVYSGMWVRAHLRAYPYGPSKDKPEVKPGVGLGLIELQKLADDTELKGDGHQSKFGAVPSDGIQPHNPMGGGAPAAMPTMPGMGGAPQNAGGLPGM